MPTSPREARSTFRLTLALMLTLSATAQAALDSGSFSPRVRVQVKDSGGTWRDMSSYGGVDWLSSASWGEDVDSDPTAEFTFKREVGDLSLAVLMEDSAMNRDFDPANPYAPLFDYGRLVRIEAAITPLDIAPASGDWFLLFNGFMDFVDSAAAEGIQVSCREATIASMLDSYIENERVYAFTGEPRGCRLWTPNTDYAIDEMVIPTNAKLNGYYFQCTSAGTSGTGEPTWPTSAGTISDGTVDWDWIGPTDSDGFAVEGEMQAILSDNLGGSAPSLYTPTPPGWDIKPYQQTRTTTLEAVRALAQQIGWELRVKWHAGTSAHRLTFFEPDRAKTTPDRTWTKQQYLSVDRLAIDGSGIRNAVRVIYSDASDLDASSFPKRKMLEVSDSTSIARYGRRFCEIAEDDTFAIDSITEATTLASNILSDLKDPKAELAITDLFFPIAELGDLYRFSGNSTHFSTNQDLAVVSYRHSVNGAEVRTTIECRGTPSGGYLKWLGKEARPGVKPNHRFGAFEGGGTMAFEATAALEGGKLTLKPSTQTKHALWDGAEYHVSSSSGFTPSSATLVASGQQKQTEVHALTPGNTYYAKVVPRYRNDGRLIRGEPTDELSFVAGRGNAGHLTSNVKWSEAPLNNGFETQTDPAAPPDHWNVTAGAWSTNFSLISDANGISSGSYIQATAASTTATMATNLFPIVGNSGSASEEIYQLGAWMKRVSGTSGSSRMSFKIETFDDDLTSLATTELDFFTGSGSTTWKKYGAQFTPGASARWARLILTVTGSSETFTCYVDNVEIRRLTSYVAAGEDQTASSNTTSSGTFATLRSITFTNVSPQSRCVALLNASMFGSAAGDKVEIRLSYNGVSQGVRKFKFASANEHEAVAMAWEFTGMNPTGPHTVLVEWRLTAGTQINIDGDDSLSLIAFEASS